MVDCANCENTAMAINDRAYCNYCLFHALVSVLEDIRDALRSRQDAPAKENQDKPEKEAIK